MGVQGKSEGRNAFSFSLESRDERGRHSWSGEHYLVCLLKRTAPTQPTGGAAAPGLRAPPSQVRTHPPGLPSLSSLPANLLSTLQGPLRYALLCETHCHSMRRINLSFLCFHGTFENNVFIATLCLVSQLGSFAGLSSH